jgi:hypothetical protein
MNWQINYLIARQRHLELVRSAEQARLEQAHLTASPSSPRAYARWLLTTHRLGANRWAAAARQANPGAPQEGLGATNDCARNTLHVLTHGERDLGGGRANADLPHPDVIDGPSPLDKRLSCLASPDRGWRKRQGPGVFTTPLRHRVCGDPDPTFIHPGAAPKGNQ